VTFTVRSHLTRPLRPLADRRTYEALLFLLSAVPLGALWITVLFAGTLVTGLLAITPLVVPALIGFAALVRLLARAEGALANRLLGAGANAPRSAPAATGFWQRGWAVLTDPGFWKAQAYLLLRFVAGWPSALIPLMLLAHGLGAIAAPLYYRWVPADEGANGLDYEIWKVDTLPEALLLVPLGLVLLVAAAYVIRVLAAPWRGLANRLLGGTISSVTSEAEKEAQRRRALAAHASVFLGVNAVLIVIWALTTRGYFWPEWVLLPTGLLLAVHGWVTLVLSKPHLVPRRLGRGFVIHLGISAALGLFLVLVWALTTRGYFWPVWPLLGLALLLLAHLAYALVTSPGRADLEKRIDVLTTSRAGAVEAQEAKLRGIERDLHDGAQARLVALGMNLGMAEQKLAADPEGARQLLSEARQGAHEALEELRDLARGIHPPVLADRGLEAAVGALAARSPIRVNVSVEADRPPAAVETAAYFVAAEALANASKHGDPTHVDIRIVRDRRVLVVEVVDDGRGGADPAGSGLTGMRRRVEALDGKLHVTSPAGGPTIIRAELPCAS
jgi:signal transduction histidine kinase